MAPLPPESTARIFVVYTVNGDQHSVSARYDDTLLTAAEAVTQMAALFAAADGSLYETTIDRAEYTNVGSNVRLPIEWTGDATYGAGTSTGQDRDNLWTWTGKSIGGRRFRLELLGIKTTVPGNFRQARATDNLADAVLTVIEGEEPIFITIDAASPIFNQYANAGDSDVWKQNHRG
jgi:hypothetical protein